MTTQSERLREGDSDKLRLLATWFDRFDDWREATGKIATGITDYREVQEDLSRIAGALAEAAPAPDLLAAVEAALAAHMQDFTEQPESFDNAQAVAENMTRYLAPLLRSAPASRETGLDAERLAEAMRHVIHRRPTVEGRHQGIHPGIDTEAVAAEYARLAISPVTAAVTPPTRTSEGSNE